MVELLVQSLFNLVIKLLNLNKIEGKYLNNFNSIYTVLTHFRTVLICSNSYLQLILETHTHKRREWLQICVRYIKSALYLRWIVWNDIIRRFLCELSGLRQYCCWLFLVFPRICTQFSHITWHCAIITCHSQKNAIGLCIVLRIVILRTCRAHQLWNKRMNRLSVSIKKNIK